MRKILISLFVALTVISLFFVVSPAKSRLESYYSGDALSYKNELYVTTTNTGTLEVFKLEDKNLFLLTSTRLREERFNNYVDFFDSKLVEEGGHLYVYAVSNYTIYKYEIVGTKLNLVKESPNTYWEWYNRIDKFGDDLATVSAKGIKIFNSNLDVVATYNFKNNDAPYNLSSNNGRYFLSINEAANVLEVYDRESNSLVNRIPFDFKFKKGNRRAYQDAASYIYIVDDSSAKKFDLSGKLLASFKHLDFQGFDITASQNTDGVYFSNGVGIVKLNSDMKLEDYAWTSNLGGHSSWAMGLKVVYNQGDKVVVFNNTNILVLDGNLKKIASVESTKEETSEYPSENLRLGLDRSRAAVNSDIILSGAGYLPKETLTIAFAQATTTVEVQSDSRGRFSETIKVPNIRPGSTDIKVTGSRSKLNYSISFLVE
ncbi:MAG: hypothetical protein ACOYL8_04900 [Patescibacteria group bacterium]